MKSFQKQAENLGGYLKVWAVPPSDLAVGDSDVFLITGNNTIEIYAAPESIQLIQEEEQTKAGFVFKTEVTAIIPKDCPQNDLFLQLLQGRKWILILLDQNEHYKVSGTNDIPHRFTCKTDPGKACSDLNAHVVSFHSTQTKKSFFISNPF